MSNANWTEDARIKLDTDVQLTRIRTELEDGLLALKVEHMGKTAELKLSGMKYKANAYAKAIKSLQTSAMKKDDTGRQQRAKRK